MSIALYTDNSRIGIGLIYETDRFEKRLTLTILNVKIVLYTVTL